MVGDDWKSIREVHNGVHVWTSHEVLYSRVCMLMGWVAIVNTVHMLGQTMWPAKMSMHSIPSLPDASIVGTPLYQAPISHLIYRKSLLI